MKRVDAFVDVLQAEAKVLTEASLSRIFSHIEGGESYALVTNFIRFTQNPGDPQFKCVKAWGVRTDVELESVNRQNLKKLKTDVQAMGYGYIRVQGRYKMATGELVSEPSLFVIGIGADQAHRLGNVYCQESVLWGAANEGTFLLNNDGSKDRIASTVRPKDFEYGWSEWKKRKFSFQEATLIYEATSFGDNYRFMESVRLGLNERYGTALVEQALDYVINGGDTAGAVNLMRLKRGG